MEQKRKKISTIIVLGFVFIFFLGFMFSNIANNVAKKNEQISVATEISVTSSVKDIIAQTYETRLTGKIQNNTDLTFENIVLRIQVTTTVLEHTGTLTINIDSLGANGEYHINDIFSTTENFEYVSKVECQINGGEFIEINNSDDGSFWWVFLFPAIVCAIITLSITTTLRKNKENIQTFDTTQQNTVFNDTSIEQPKPETTVYCEYCRSKNDSKEKKCSSCGAPLK